MGIGSGVSTSLIKGVARAGNGKAEFISDTDRIQPKVKQLWIVTLDLSWETLFYPYTKNKGVDQPAHPRSLISTFVVRNLDSIRLAKSKISRL